MHLKNKWTLLHLIPPGQAGRLLLSYQWLSLPIGGGPSTIDPIGASDTLDHVERDIEEILTKKPRTTAFRKNDHGHLMLLIADLVALNVIILQHEIQELLHGLGIRTGPQELRKYLFLLEQLALISTSHYGHLDYYINATGASEYIFYAPRAPTDRSRLRTLVRRDLQLTSEKTRALDAFRRTAGLGRE